MDKFKIQSCFSGAANSYDAAAKVQVQAIDLTLECLDQISRGDNRAKRLLDLGSGTGLSRDKLLLQHKNTYYVALDLSLAMLSYAQHNQKQPETVNYPSICADSAHLPLQNQSFDLILSNSMLQWCEDLPAVFSECRRVLDDNGVLVFSTFGPDSLKELRQAFGAVDEDAHVGVFAALQEIEKALLIAGFEQIELTTVLLEIGYRHPIDLLRDLKAVGANHHKSSSKGLFGKSKFSKMLANYPASAHNLGIYPATYEVIYGTAKKTQ